MIKYEIFKEKARSLRKDGKSLTEICQLLQLNKSTVYGWIEDIEIHIQRQIPKSFHNGNKIREIFKAKRDSYYQEGVVEYEKLSVNPKFRDSIILYICEGHKKNRNSVGFTNSDPLLIKIVFDTLCPLTSKKSNLSAQVHLDNNFDEVKLFWSNYLHVNASDIKIYPRKISMTNRNTRLPNGIFQFSFNDTRLRSRLQAWIDIVKKEWSGWGDSNARCSYALAPKASPVPTTVYTPTQFI
jgi:hypothetical protein